MPGSDLMDNRTIDVVSEGEEGIALAMRLIWPNAAGGKATHYRVVSLLGKTEYFQNDEGKTTHHFADLVEDEKDGIPTMILLWSGEKDAKLLPFSLDLDGATQFVRGWLRQVKYGLRPDHDGRNEKGWRIFTEGWGHVAGFHYAIVAVQPVWAMYGR